MKDSVTASPGFVRISEMSGPYIEIMMILQYASGSQRYTRQADVLVPGTLVGSNITILLSTLQPVNLAVFFCVLPCSFMVSCLPLYRLVPTC